MENIPPGLQALMNAQEMLGISMTAPGPQGEQPTVASQILQQAQMQGVKQQAGIGAMIQAQQQAQRQRAAQDPDEIARRVAMLMRGQGLGNLPLQMGFAEGGIIGYNGEGESVVTRDVPVPEIQADPRYIELRRQGVDARTAYDTVRQSLAQEPAPVIQPRVLGSLSPALDLERRAEAAQQTQESSRGLSILPSTVEALQRPARVMASETGAQEAPEGAVSTPERRDFTITRVPEEKPPTVTLPDIQMPTRPAAPGQGIQGLPNFQERVEALRKLSAEEEAARSKLPSLEARGIEALQKAETDRQRLLEQQRKNDFINKLMAFGRDLYTRGNTYQNVQRGIDLREEQNVQAQFNNEKAQLELQRAQQERDLGRFTRARALESDVTTLLDKSADNLLKSAQIEGIMGANMYSADMKAWADIKTSQATLLSRAAELRELAAQRRLTSISAAATAAQAKLTDILTKLNTEEEKRFPLLKIARATGTIDESARKQIQEAAAWRREQERAADYQGAKQQLDLLREQLMAETPIRFDRAGQQVK
jgi:hypothetical protein